MNLAGFNIALPELGSPDAPNAAKIDLAIYSVERTLLNIPDSTDLDSEAQPDKVVQFYMGQDQLRKIGQCFLDSADFLQKLHG